MTAPSPSAGRIDDMKRALVAIRDLRRRVSELESARESDPDAGAAEPIAIVGMSCRLPGGASTPQKFWELLRDGVDATGDIPADRWDVEQYYDPDPDAPGRSYVRRGGFLREPVDRFDPGFFGISPREADAMDPTHRMLLELAWEALEHAAIPPHRLEGSNTGVFIGMSGSDYDVLQRDNTAAINSYRGTGSVASIAAGRLSHFLGLHGANVALDTACSSALVALALAVDAIRSGRCNLALAGTGHLILSHEGTIMLCKLRALAADGRCRTFDASAGGYARAEGGGMFVLKKLSAALADGDPIQAVIRGVAVNHDGRASGLTVPNANAQRAVIAAALQDARLAPSDVTYVEAHGTATPLGDPIELRALADVLGGTRPLMLGSVKTNIGHLEPAAGAASLAKVVLSLQHRQIPAHLHLHELTPHVPWHELNLHVPTSLTPWNAPRRIAGISAFGFSGTNAHIIVEEAPPRAVDQRQRRPAELILLSGRSRQAVVDLAGRYAATLETGGDDAIANLAVTSTTGRSAMPFRTSVVGTDAHELRAALAELANDGADRIEQFKAVSPAPLAMMFTGQGAQYPAMARDLYHSAPVFRRTLDHCATLLNSHLDRPLLPLMLEDVPADVLRQTAYTQPALFAFEFALATLWQSWGIVPNCVLGHSLGEYVAATVADVFAVEDILPVIALRGRLMQQLPGGGRMTAVFTSEARVTAVMAGVDGVSIAAINAPDNTVISGVAEAVASVLARLSVDGVQFRDLEVSHAFHSQLMDPMLDEFEQAMATIPRNAPRITLISNVTGQPLSDTEALDPARWRHHVREAVRFGPSIETAQQRGVRTFVEVGPHPTLCALGAQSVTAPTRWLPSVRRNVMPWRTLAESVGALFQAGHDLDWSAWAADFGGTRSSGAPTYAFQRERHWFTDDDTPHQPSQPMAQPRAQRALRTAESDLGHPLLHAVLQSPALDGWAFESILEPQHPTYLADHVVQDTLVVPGALFIELAVAALAAGPRWNTAHVRQLTIERPLLLAPDAVTVCQVLVSAPVDGEAMVRVVSRSLEGDDVRWTTHASARARAQTAPESPSHTGPSPLASLRQSIGDAFDVGVLRERLQSRGLRYGPAFQGLQDVWTGNGESLGLARLPGAVAHDARRYRVHPCLMDAAFQLLASLGSTENESADMYLPSGVDSLTVIGHLGEACWIHAKRQTDGADADELVADIHLYAEDGTPCAILHGFRARRLRGGLTRPSETASLYTVQWETTQQPAVPIAGLDGNWLLLEDHTGVGAAIADALSARGARIVRVRRAMGAPPADDIIDVEPDSAAAWTRVAEALATGDRVAGVVHCWALDDAPGEDASANEWLEHVIGLTSALPQVLHIDGVDRAPFGVRVVTRGADGPEHDAAVGAEAGATLQGALRVLQSEYPTLACRSIDLDARRAHGGADDLLALLFGTSLDDRLVVRGEHVYTARLVRDGQPQPVDVRPLPEGPCYRVAISQRGTLDTLHYVSTQRRAPDVDEVEVRVATTGLNFRDVLNVLGMYPGEAGDPGVEFAGTVTRIGNNVSHVDVGDAVVGIGGGTFASHVTGPAAAVTRAPRALNAVEAATIPLAFLTAEWGLADLAALQTGERVLIHAAAGGVGQAAVHLAIARGAEVFATAGSDAKRAHLRAQGVRHVFDSRSAAFAEQIRAATDGAGVDVVLNSLSGELVPLSLGLLRPGGRFIEIGKSDLQDPAVVASQYPGVRYHAFDLGTILVEHPATFQSLFQRVTARFDAGTLRPIPTRVYPAEDIVEAFRFMAQARHIGKLVVSSGRRWGSDALVRGDGTYLVTGAGGGLGRTIVEWLVAQGAGAVVLSGRSAATAELAEWMARLGADGTTRLTWQSADIAQRHEAEQLFAAISTTEAPLRGIFHAAGVLDDGLLVDLAAARFRRVMEPKIAGAWHLHQLSKRFDLDFFVLFSSIAALLGSRGQGNYAAANAFLDALAESRARQGLPALSVNWGAWGDVGMASRLPERERTAMAERGLGLLDAGQAMRALTQLLRDGRHRASVVKMDWRRAVQTSPRVPPLLSRLLSAPTAPSNAPSTTAARPHLDLATLAAGDATSARETLLPYICATLGNVLGLRGKTIAPDDLIAQLGFDSLMAMELRNRLEAETGTVVPVAQLLGSATPADIAEAMLGVFATLRATAPNGTATNGTAPNVTPPVPSPSATGEPHAVETFDF